MTDNPAGWQADPTGRHEHRYWDGSQWTDNVADGGVANTDAYEAGAGAGGETVDAGADPIVDPTVAEPVTPADTTAAWPTSGASPRPPVPPTYAGPVQPESGGSKRKLLIGGILAAVAIAVVAFLLMGGDDDDSDVEARLAAQIKSESDGQLSDEQADCVAAHLVDEIGEERMAEVDFNSDEPPEGMEDELGAASFGAITACDIDPTALGGGSSDRNGPTNDGEGEGGGPGAVEFDGDTEEMLADIYEESLGLDRHKAECLAGRLGEAISSGDLSEQEAMSDVFSFLEDCDISMEEISN
jgi:hypothetical protein